MKVYFYLFVYWFWHICLSSFDFSYTSKTKLKRIVLSTKLSQNFCCRFPFFEGFRSLEAKYLGLKKVLKLFCDALSSQRQQMVRLFIDKYLIDFNTNKLEKKFAEFVDTSQPLEKCFEIIQNILLTTLLDFFLAALGNVKSMDFQKKNLRTENQS